MKKTDGRKGISVLNTWKAVEFAAGENEKVLSFKVHVDFFNTYYAKRTFLLSANIYSMGFSKPVLCFVDVYKRASDSYAGYVVNLSDTRFKRVDVTMDGIYLNVSVTFNSYEGSGCVVSCHSLSNIPIF